MDQKTIFLVHRNYGKGRYTRPNDEVIWLSSKSNKWWKTIFYGLLMLDIVNEWIICKKKMNKKKSINSIPSNFIWRNDSQRNKSSIRTLFVKKRKTILKLKTEKCIFISSSIGTTRRDVNGMLKVYLEAYKYENNLLRMWRFILF